MPSLRRRQQGWWATAVGVALLAADAGAALAQDRRLIEEGRQLFLEETFDGNGRTCGTCHPPDNNFTLDPQYIRGLRGNDPLFVAKGRLNALEENRLIRSRALFLENLDGFENPGVMRSVPHTLALRTSLKPEAPVAALGFGHATGWSGDGSPNARGLGDGSLRSFATGAVIQHFTRDLRRRPGIDFRLPTPRELDALEAFQLSLGRQEDIDLAALAFSDRFVNLGKELFEGARDRQGGVRRCSGCHANAGAAAPDGVNRNRDTGTALLPTAPACLPGSFAPGDGGLGHEPVMTEDRRDICGGGRPADVVFRGDGTFNTPPLIEAADTPPFFHNNAVDTIEEAVAFYTTDIFDASPAGDGRAFVLDRREVNAIAALLRALNVLENIRSSNAYYDEALAAGFGPARARESVELALVENDDALTVLTGGPVRLFAGMGVREALEEARDLGERALKEGLAHDLILAAILKQEDAAALIRAD